MDRNSSDHRLEVASIVAEAVKAVAYVHNDIAEYGWEYHCDLLMKTGASLAKVFDAQGLGTSDKDFIRARKHCDESVAEIEEEERQDELTARSRGLCEAWEKARDAELAAETEEERERLHKLERKAWHEWGEAIKEREKNDE